MTENMQRLYARRDELFKQFDNLANENKLGTESKALLDEADALQDQIDQLERAENMQKTTILNGTVAIPKDAQGGFKIIANAIKTGKFQNEIGEELKTGGLNGEDYLLPEDVKLQINEYKKQWKSAKDIVTVINTVCLSGSFNFGKDPTDGLIAFDDGGEVDSSKLPEFVQGKYQIKWYGAIIPISTILQGAERAGLMQFIDIWFVRRSIIVENKKIFETLKSGYNQGVPKQIASEKALRRAINMDLDPAFLESPNMVIVTNQSGFAYLDSLYDENGRPLLQPDPVDATVKRYKGIRVEMFSDAQFPNHSADHAPIIFGDTKDGVWMHVYEDYFFDTDNGKGLGFAKNQALLKVIEGFALTVADGNAYVYAEVKLGTQLTAPTVSITSNKGSWATVEHATGYEYKIDEGAVRYTATALSDVALTSGQTLYVRALGDGVAYLDSAWGSKKNG